MRFPQAFSKTSNYGFNHVNAGAETFSRSFMMGADLANTTPNIDLKNFNIGRNGLDLNERMVEISRSCVNPKRVEVKSRIDYLPEPKQTSLSLTEQIRGSEIIRTQEMLRTKFIQSPFPDDAALRLNERLRRPVFEDQTNHPYPFTRQNPLHDTRLQLYNQDRNSHHIGLNLDQANKFFGSSDRNMLCCHNNDQHGPSVRQVDQVLEPDPISVYFDEIPQEKLRKPTQEFNFLELTLRPPNPGFANYLDLFPRITSEDEDDKEHQDENDVPVGHGRTRSLPHKKYGPYTCPKCRGVFVTSQLFAAHMSAHYRTDGNNEKGRRRAGKNKSPNIHLLHTKHGLKLLPKSFKPSEAKKKWRKSTLWISDEESSTEESKGRVAGENVGVRLEGFFDVEVKPQLA